MLASTLTGLAASHTRGHVIRAVLEGVAFSLKDTFSLFSEMKVPVNNVRLGAEAERVPTCGGRFRPTFTGM